MRAIRIYKHGGPEVLQFEDGLPVPEPPPGCLRVKIVAIGVTQLDTYARNGTFGRILELPCILGTDFAGIVDIVSPEVEKLNKYHIGARVYGTLCKGTGTYSEYCIVDPSVDYIEILPEHVDFECGSAATTTYAIAYRALFVKGKCKPNQVVLVHGDLGGVGTAAIEMATHMGASVIATAGSVSDMSIARSAGATHVFNRSQDGYIQQILDCTQGLGVQLIIESAPQLHLAQDLFLIRENGRIVLVGGSGNAVLDSQEWMSKEAHIMGLMLFNASHDELREAWMYIHAGLEHRTLNPIVQTYPFEEFVAAHKELESPSLGVSAGRIVLQLSHV